MQSIILQLSRMFLDDFLALLAGAVRSTRTLAKGSLKRLARVSGITDFLETLRAASRLT